MKLCFKRPFHLARMTVGSPCRLWGAAAIAPLFGFRRLQIHEPNRLNDVAWCPSEFVAIEDANDVRLSLVLRTNPFEHERIACALRVKLFYLVRVTAEMMDVDKKLCHCRLQQTLENIVSLRSNGRLTEPALADR